MLKDGLLHKVTIITFYFFNDGQTLLTPLRTCQRFCCFHMSIWKAAQKVPLRHYIKPPTPLQLNGRPNLTVGEKSLNGMAIIKRTLTASLCMCAGLSQNLINTLFSIGQCALRSTPCPNFVIYKTNIFAGEKKFCDIYERTVSF